MTKVVKFPEQRPEKFGLQRVTKKTDAAPVKPGQLNLFTGAKVVRLNQLSTFEEALMLDEHGDLANAIKAYRQAIEEGDNIADAYCNLGILESQVGHRAEAITCFTQCLKFDPRHHEAHYNLANLYAEVGNYEPARVHYAIAIEIEPSFPNGYFNLGLTLAVNRDFKGAIEMLLKYKQLTPGEDHSQTDSLINSLASTLS
jgi:tetratricopeptide (TPR) repeat protein